jgi:butyryl-CoA dehydrogenase
MSRFLTEEQELIRKVAREFTENEVKPRAMEIDKANDFPFDLHKRCGELGFLGVLFPESVGGLGQSFTTACVICEEIAKEAPGFAISLFVSMAAPTFMLAKPELAMKYVPDLIAGNKVCCTPITPPEGSTNHAEWGVFGKRDGNDWVLNGTKLYITNTRAADIFICLGLTEDYQMGCWIVEKGTPGVEDNHVERKMGCAGNNSGTYVFNNCRVSNDNFIVLNMEGDVGGGNALCASVALGCAEGVFAKTLEFVKVRTRGGKPLATKQAVSHRLARMYAQIEGGRSMLYEATRLVEEGRLQEAKILINASKYTVTEMAVDVARQCVQLHGGMGYCEDAGIARYLRDAMGTTIADCTPDLHLESIAFQLGCPEAEMPC